MIAIEPRGTRVFRGAVIGLCLVGTLVLGGSVDAAHAEELDRPMRMFVRTLDGDEYRGEMVAFDAKGFKLVDPDDKPHQIAWGRLKPRRVLAIHRHLLPPDDAMAWLRLGVLLHGEEDGKPQAEIAFRRALAIDDSLEPMVDRAREGEPLKPADDGEDTEAGAGSKATPGSPTDPDPPDTETPGDGAGENAQGPKRVGPVKSKFWGNLSDELMTQSVKELEDFAGQTQKRMGLNLNLYQTQYFLFYSDLDRREAIRWANLLDRMYTRLADLFGLAEGRNIFRGKCLIIVFQHEEDYHRFQLVMHHTDSTGTAGMCHGFGNGFVHVAFYRQPNDGDFAHVLVHETVHGFLDRFRSSTPITTWINEGLAETIAEELVPQGRQDDRAVSLAELVLKRDDSMHGMFYLPELDFWQYGVARLLTQYLIRQDRRRYAQLIEGIKAGKPWAQSLEDSFGVTPDQLAYHFGRSIHINGLKP